MPKKIVITKLGGAEVLDYVDYTLPNNVAENYVRIKQAAIGLNYIDIYYRSGVYPIPQPLPICPGLEAAGEVVLIGKNVKNISVGDRVCYATAPMGAYCEIRDFPADKLIKIPNDISDDEAASIILQGMTVEYLFKRLYEIKKDQHVLFHAAAGGVGLVACQWAKSVGCILIGTVGSNEKADLAKKNGCSYTINYKTENVVEKVNEITGGRGVPIVYDGVGKDTFQISLDCLSLRGLFVSFGQSSGMVPDVNLHKTFNPKSLYYTRPTLMHYNATREELLSSSGALFNLMKKGVVRANLSKIYCLKDASSAHIDLETRSTVGSVVLKP